MKPTTRVFNIRGTNGSGKTFMVRRLLQEREAVAYPRRANLLGGETVCGRVEYYKLNDGGIVLGSYEKNCGGCDTLKNFGTIAAAVEQRLAERPPYLIFEGVIVSHIYGYWQRFSQKIGGMTWVFLDTPLDVCLQRVYSRNNEKKINEKYVREKHHAIGTIVDKARADGEQVVVLPWRKAYEEFARLLNGKKR